VIYCCEHHDEMLLDWRRRDLRDVALAHVDFHDDLRGLLVDRRRDRAYRIGRATHELPALDAGNVLAHAVVEGRLRRLRWIHDLPGGRAWDAGIVRYESDLFAIHHRLRQRLAGGAEFPLDFQESLLDTWSGPLPGELLSIDWDCFASILIDATSIDDRVERFIARMGSEIPPDTYVIYSPEYSHPTLDAFKRFVGRLGSLTDQPLEWLSDGLAQGQLSLTSACPDPPRDPLMRLALFMRRRGLY